VQRRDTKTEASGQVFADAWMLFDYFADEVITILALVPDSQS